MFFGILLIILGAMLLLNEFGIISWHHWGMLWPVIIIAIGVRMLFTKVQLKDKNPQ